MQVQKRNLNKWSINMYYYHLKYMCILKCKICKFGITLNLKYNLSSGLFPTVFSIIIICTSYVNYYMRTIHWAYSCFWRYSNTFTCWFWCLRLEKQIFRYVNYCWNDHFRYFRSSLNLFIDLTCYILPWPFGFSSQCLCVCYEVTTKRLIFVLIIRKKIPYILRSPL